MGSWSDRHCRYRTQVRIKRWLICSAIVLGILAVLASIVVLVLRFALTPQVTVKVEHTRLDTFLFDTKQSGGVTTSFLSYNISVDLAVRNPNQAMSIRYAKPLVASFVFHDRRLKNVTVVEEGQYRHRPGTTTVRRLNASGEVPSVILGAAASDDFKKQNATGLFMVDVLLSGEITYQWIVFAQNPKLTMSCPLRLQVAPPGPEVIVLHEVNCKPVKQDKIYN